MEVVLDRVSHLVLGQPLGLFKAMNDWDEVVDPSYREVEMSEPV